MPEALHRPTLLDVQLCRCRTSWAEGAARLKKDALSADKALRMIGGFILTSTSGGDRDVIQYYKPAHLTKNDTQTARQAQGTYSQAGLRKEATCPSRELNKTLANMGRTSCKSHHRFMKERDALLTSYGSSEAAKTGKGFESKSYYSLTEIRAALNQHLLKILEAKVNKLRLVGVRVSAPWKTGEELQLTSTKAYWEETLLDTQSLNGAAQFTQEMLSLGCAAESLMLSLQGCHHQLHILVSCHWRQWGN